MILGKFYDQITWMALGVWFSSYYSEERGEKNSSGPKRLPLTFGLSGRRTRFAGPIERHFSRGAVRLRPTAERVIYIYTIIRDRKRQIESFIPMTQTPLFLLPTLIVWVYRDMCIYIYILYQYCICIYKYILIINTIRPPGRRRWVPAIQL